MSDQSNKKVSYWQQEIILQLQQSAEVQNRVAQECIQSILVAADIMANSLQSGGKIMLCGNGGSAADSQHMAAELMGRLAKDFERPALAALALTTDTSFLTAFANDYSFDDVFARQVEALGKPGDVLVGISTSGHSTNVIRAIEQAHRQRLHTIGLLGADGGQMMKIVDNSIIVPSNNTQRIQEGMLAIEHVLCYLIERYLFSQN